MAILAEEIVEEWLNRKGYFTIRGVKLGVDEIDLLAAKFLASGKCECRHIEVQASMRPISYISRVPKSDQRKGVRANSATRTNDQLVSGVSEWVETKFRKANKVELMRRLFPSPWTSELVLNNVKSAEEVELIRAHGITIHRLPGIIGEMSAGHGEIQSAAGADFFDLISMGQQTTDQKAGG